MSNNHRLDQLIAEASVDASIFALRPDYRVLLIALEGLVPAASDATSEALLMSAEAHASRLLDGAPVDALPHIAAWRDAFRSFGAKPQRTRNSLEALTRRAPGGLPRLNRLTDVYNAISILHQIPVGGEDLDCYDGAPFLKRANGDEPFDTVSEGDVIVEHPEPGEVIWCDNAGITCRRWNWRQCRRTALTDATTSALFILDALDPMSNDALEAAGDALIAQLSARNNQLDVARRIISVTG